MEVYIYFPLVYFSFIQDSWSYFVSNTTATWTEEDAECKMATPTILYEGLKLNLTIDKPIPNIGVWVGYYERMALFDYIGCIKTQNAPATSSIQLRESTPGRCYSACSYSQYIGIEKPKCYCFDTEPGKNITEQGCNETCDDMSQTVCGGKDHISLYRISTNDTDIIPKTGEYKCLQIEFKEDEGKYNWRNCKSKMWASCTSDSQKPVQILEEPKSWNDAAKLCFTNKSYPTRSEDISQITDSNKYFWTGVVRSSVISKSTELGNISSDILYGYMTYDNASGYVLKFKQANDTRHILCENAAVTEASNPTITVSYATATQVNGSTMSLKNSSYERKNTQGSDVTVFVIVSVSVLALIAIVVVILIQVKRKKFPFLCKRELTTEEPGQKHLKSTKNAASHENHSYELVDVEDNVIGGQSADSNYTHTYNVLEEHVKDFITDDTTYDVSGNNRKTTEMENENIYNKLKPDDNATYDHAYNTTKHGLQTPDISYGTSGNGGMKPLARAAKTSDAFDENGENAYSHTLDNRPHMTTTDNVYSAAHGQAGNDTRDTGEGHNDTGDAYSHINNATNDRSKQDIAYGKSTEGNLKENSEGDYDVTDEHSCSPNVDNEY